VTLTDRFNRIRPTRSSGLGWLPAARGLFGAGHAGLAPMGRSGSYCQPQPVS